MIKDLKQVYQKVNQIKDYLKMKNLNEYEKELSNAMFGSTSGEILGGIRLSLQRIISDNLIEETTKKEMLEIIEFVNKAWQ